jgi:flagellar hook-associated protein 3 FlgL
MTCNTTGDVLFNTGSCSAPTSPDVFETISLLKQEITSGDTDAISARLDDVDANLNNVVAIRSQVGARIARLESTLKIVQDSQIVFKTLLSETEDADLAEALVELSTRENVYQAAISAMNRILYVSLVNYLK